MESHPAQHMTSQSGRGMAHGPGMNSWIITQWSQRQPASQKYWNAPLKAQLMYHATRWKNRVPFFRTQCTYSVGDLNRCAPQQEGRRAGGASLAPPLDPASCYVHLCAPQPSTSGLCRVAPAQSHMKPPVWQYTLQFISWTSWLEFVLLISVLLIFSSSWLWWWFHWYMPVKTHQIVHFKQLCLIKLLKKENLTIWNAWSQKTKMLRLFQ